MNTNSTIADPVDGEKRRVIVLGGEHTGCDMVLDFGDLDRPGRTYRAIVLSGQVRDGRLEIGDQCILRYREAHRFRSRPERAKWLFVERTDEEFVDCDAEVEAMTAHALA